MLFGDVAKFCHACKGGISTRDIVGPLPRTTSGKRFILVVCDYATRYPEVVALSSTDAEHVAEELVRIFSRVGIPGEILTDQGPNLCPSS